MSEAAMPGGHPGESLVPPATGEAAVDEALRSLADLESVPVDGHHDRLARAHEALQAALEKGSVAQHPADPG
jgi:hypothetical protein